MKLVAVHVLIAVMQVCFPTVAHEANVRCTEGVSRYFGYKNYTEYIKGSARSPIILSVPHPGGLSQATKYT